MFGLTFEKLIIIGVIAVVVIGPARLPGYAQKLADLVRSFRSFVDVMKTRTESELGMPIDTVEWNARLREYDPRTIVKNALHDVADPTPPDPTPPDPTSGMRERWIIVGGSSGHPVRKKILEPIPESEYDDAVSVDPTATAG